MTSSVSRADVLFFRLVLARFNVRALVRGSERGCRTANEERLEHPGKRYIVDMRGRTSSGGEAVSQHQATDQSARAMS